MPSPKRPPVAVELTDEEKQELEKARATISNKAYRGRLREEIGVTTYAQRAASRRARAEEKRKKTEKAEQDLRALAERRLRAAQLWLSGMSKARVAVELQVSANTIHTWLKGMTRPEPEPPPDPIQTALTAETTAAVDDIRLMERDAEQQTILEMAEAHDKPSDKYQAYIAASAIRLLRDNMALVRGPRTIRELSELDQLIRRNLGLNPRGGNTGAVLNIDVNILNNTKASNGAIGHVTLDAELA